MVELLFGRKAPEHTAVCQNQERPLTLCSDNVIRVDETLGSFRTPTSPETTAKYDKRDFLRKTLK